MATLQVVTGSGYGRRVDGGMGMAAGQLGPQAAGMAYNERGDTQQPEP